MGLSQENGLHWGAVKWYYEFVAGYGPGVPEAMVRHIRQCLICRKQIERLQEAVTGAGGETDRSRSTMKRDVIDTLSLHFGCLEERVTCARVKPFLPGLLIRSAPIRIPTPITVHIDHCPECADDLRDLQDLGLTAEQLERLEQLYRGESLGAKPFSGLRTVAVRPALASARLRLGEALQCRRARTGVSDFVHGRLEDIDAEILNHLCTCPRCRLHVYRSRQRLLESEPSGRSATLDVCPDEVPINRLFDYAVPYGRTADGQDRVDQAHVRTCRACLRRIQELDETVYGIAERSDSGVATVYSTAEHDAPPHGIIPMHGGMSSADPIEGAEAGVVADVYPDYPIRVQVIHGQPQSAVAIAAGKRATFDPRIRFLLKTAVAAAAMIPLAVLFLNTSPASGTTLAQVVRAFKEAQNVHVTAFYPNAGQITQELWISRATDRVFMTVGQEHALYDLDRKEKLAGPGSLRPGALTSLNDRQCAEVRRAIDACLGFTLGDIPNGAKWTRLDDDSTQEVEVWELTYAERDRSEIAFLRRLTISMNPATRLPSEVRTFRKRPTETEWHYLLRTECQYLTNAEMATIIKDPTEQ